MVGDREPGGPGGKGGRKNMGGGNWEYTILINV